MAENGYAHLRFIDRELRKIELGRDNLTLHYPLNLVPEVLYDAMLGLADGKEAPLEISDSMSQRAIHKPIMSTFDPTHPFPVNAATKIVWLTLNDDAIEDKIDELQGLFLTWQGRSFEDTLEERLQTYKELFVDDSLIDRFRLGAIEMYGSTTYANIKRDPRVTLGFSWFQSKPAAFHGVQINCIAEIVKPSDPFYIYMSFMRNLFSTTFIELGTAEYPCAYRLWVSEIKEKALRDATGYSIID
ncbi:MAG: hypothetical protein ACXADL_03415 [Candidatus Thorarchaeota archaeon]|jgi:hypothetical protein